MEIIKINGISRICKLILKFGFVEVVIISAYFPTMKNNNKNQTIDNSTEIFFMYNELDNIIKTHNNKTSQIYIGADTNVKFGILKD